MAKKPTDPVNSIYTGFTVNTKQDDCFVVVFDSQSQFDEMADKLKGKYNFSDSKNNSATIAQTVVESRKVTLTLYKTTPKLMIKGAGSKVWVSTVFEEVSSLPASNSDSEREFCQSDNTPNRRTTFVAETPYGPFPPKVSKSKSKSPLKYISKLVFGGSSVSSSPSNYCQNELQTSPVFNKKGKKGYNGPANYKPTAKAPEIDNDVEKETSSKDSKDVSEETFCKQPFQVKENSISEKIKHSNSVMSQSNLDILTVYVHPQPDIDSVKETDKDPRTEECKVTDNTSTEQLECSINDWRQSNKHSEHQQEQNKNRDQDNTKELRKCQQELLNIKKEKNDLQTQLKEFLTQSELLRAQNEKLLQEMELQKEKSKNTSESLEKEVKKCERYKKELKSVTENYQKEIQSLSAKLSDETALSLTLEEENKKLKTKLDSVTKEKRDLVSQMSRSNGTADMLEEKIENLTDLFVKEMSELKSQFEKSVAKTKSPNTLPADTNPTPQAVQSRNNSADNQEEPTVTITDTTPVNQKSHTILIVGDSVTRILSRNKMIDTNIDVKIKSHPGGKLQDIHNTILSMAENDDEYLCNIDAVIIHAGTNNLSDGDPVDDIVKQNKHIAETIQQINQRCHIIISSILPRKNDKLANKVIEQTNQSLKEFCDASSLVFLDNSVSFNSHEENAHSLYKDNIHLNAKGGKALGEAMCEKIRNIFELPTCAQSSIGQKQNFQNGRLSGRRTANDNMTNNRGENNNNSNNRSSYKAHNNNNRANSYTANSTRGNNHKGNGNRDNNKTWGNNSTDRTNNHWNNSQPWMNNNSPMMYMPMPFSQPPWFSHNQATTTQ